MSHPWAFCWVFWQGQRLYLSRILCIVILFFCAIALEAQWWKSHLTRKTGVQGTSLMPTAAWLLKQKSISLLWAFTPQSKSSTSHCFFRCCCCCCCKFALAPATPSLWRSLDLDFAALVMSHSNILTHPSILVRGLVKQQKDRKLLVQIPKWRSKCWKTSSAFICPQLRQRSCAASINISAS